MVAGGRRADPWSFGVKSVASKLSGEKGAYSDGLLRSLKLCKSLQCNEPTTIPIHQSIHTSTPWLQSRCLHAGSKSIDCGCVSCKFRYPRNLSRCC